MSLSPRLSPRRLGPIRSPCWSCSSCWCDHVRDSQSSRGVFLQFFIRLRHLHQSRSAQRVYRHETLRRAAGVVPLPLARGDFFALSCGCPAGAQALLLLALAVALVSWPLAWMLQLEVPPGWRWLSCVLADVGKVCAEGCVRPGSGPAEAQLASWPWPQARRRARPQVPAVPAVRTLQQQQRPATSIPQPCEGLAGHVRGLAGKHLARHTMAPCSRNQFMPIDRLHGQLSSAPSAASGSSSEFSYQIPKAGFIERGIFARRGQGGGGMQTKTKTGRGPRQHSVIAYMEMVVVMAALEISRDLEKGEALFEVCGPWPHVFQ